MDPSAPQTVAKGVVITCKSVFPTVCGATAGLYGVFKGRAPGPLLVFSALNSGIAAATFLSIREYVVGPALTLTHPGKQYQARRRRLGGLPASLDEPSLTWFDLRTTNLLDSTISGAFAGGILNAWKRGRSGLVPGITTGAVMCAVLQWTFNEFDILRINYALRARATSTSAAPALPINVVAPQLPKPVVAQPSESQPLLDRILSKLGHKMSDEEYLKRMKAQRTAHLRRIEELEQELGDSNKS
ncbi:hypothetical protein BV22DRAFT_1104149 [Leucogyrophana mollusca]|uniref:Uncharacterized protein n=1 Tax=Leucogyrophana mollusca TaxID=85980 RepID=A0ACB8BM28_9AGAM|nr:hypothetical protein BV22DRAFT_1104149 [Leucogyrophana mollusca]